LSFKLLISKLEVDIFVSIFGIVCSLIFLISNFKLFLASSWIFSVFLISASVFGFFIASLFSQIFLVVSATINPSATFFLLFVSLPFFVLSKVLSKLKDAIFSLVKDFKNHSKPFLLFLSLNSKYNRFKILFSGNFVQLEFSPVKIDTQKSLSSFISDIFSSGFNASLYFSISL